MKILKWYNSQDDKNVNLCEIDLSVNLTETKKLEIFKKVLKINQSELLDDYELNEGDELYISELKLPKLSELNINDLKVISKSKSTAYKEFLKELLITRQNELKELKLERRTKFAISEILETYWRYKEPFWTIDVNSIATKNAFQIKQTFEKVSKIDESEFIKSYQMWYGFGSSIGSKPTLTYEQFLQFLPTDLEICLKIRQINNTKRKLGTFK